MLECLQGEKEHHYYKTIFRMARISNFVRFILVKLLPMLGESRAALLLNATHAKSAYELWQLVGEQKLYIEEYWSSWNANQLDLVIAPGQALPPYYHGQSKDLQLSCLTTFLNNLIPSCAGSVPITTVKRDEQRYDDKWNDRYTKLSRDVMKDSAGLPCGVQVIGKLFHEELVLRLMKEIETICPFNMRSEVSKQINILQKVD